MRKLAYFSFAFAGAIAVWKTIGIHIWFLAALLVAAFLCFRLKDAARLRAILIVTGILAGLLWGTVYAAFTYTPAERLDGASGTYAFTVTAYPKENEYGTYIRTSLKQEGAQNITTRLYLTGDYTDLEPGDILTVSASLSLADSIYGEDTDYYTADGVYLKAYADGAPSVSRTDAAMRIRYLPLKAARALQAKIKEIFPEDTAGFALAIVTGDKSLLNDDVNTNLRMSGVSHIIAVSGMHVSFLVSLFMLLVGRRRRYALCCLPVIVFFMAMVGFTPSVVRAGIMAAFVLLAPALRRESDTLTSMSAALLVLLAANPYAIAGVSLQLSFAAVLGLALFSGRLNGWFKRVFSAIPFYEKKPVKRLLNFIAASLATTLAALVFTTPLTAFHFSYISVYAPLSNLLIVWAASIVFCGVIVITIVGFLLTPLGAILAAALSWLIRCIQGVSGLIAGLPGALLYTLGIYIQIWLVTTYAVLAVFLITPGKRRPLIPLSACITLFCLCFFLGIFEADTTELEVTVLDVGQGQSVYMNVGGSSILVDCGSETGKSAGEIAAKYMFGESVYSLDLLILTHFHRDHVSGVTDLMDRMKIETLVIPEPADDEAGYGAAIIAKAEDLGIDICYVTENMVFSLQTGEVCVTAPVGRWTQNEMGLTILGAIGGYEALITGDMGAGMERRLIQLTDLPDIEILVVGHHGSRYSTSAELLDAVTPEVAIISVGSGNSYGHPADETLARLAEYGMDIYRTDDSGTVTVRVSN